LCNVEKIGFVKHEYRAVSQAVLAKAKRHVVPFERQAHKNEMLSVALPLQALLADYCIIIKIYKNSVVGNIFYCYFKFV